VIKRELRTRSSTRINELDTPEKSARFFRYIHRFIPAVAIKLDGEYIQISSKLRIARLNSTHLAKQPAWSGLAFMLQDRKILKVLGTSTWPCLDESIDIQTALLLQNLERLVKSARPVQLQESHDKTATATAMLEQFNKLDTERLSVCPDRALPIHRTLTLSPNLTSTQTGPELDWTPSIDKIQESMRTQVATAKSVRKRLTEHLAAAEARRQASLQNAAERKN
jgi:hypothetical protein